MRFLGIDDPAIANHVSCLIDGLIYQRAFTPEVVAIEKQMELLGLMISAYFNKI
jgi:hypothetical protein